jgi:hypothetical protein
LAKYLDSHPEELAKVFNTKTGLWIYGTIAEMLKPDTKKSAKRYIRGLIIKLGLLLANPGYQRKMLVTLDNTSLSDDIEIDKTIENITQAPDRPIEDNISVLARKKKKQDIVIMLDRSFSMKGIKTILSAITAASIVLHFKGRISVIFFNDTPRFIKKKNHMMTVNSIVDEILDLRVEGGTNIKDALELGITEVSSSDRRMGILLTDGNWTIGPNPLKVAQKYDKLNVICFPPADRKKSKLLAIKGNGVLAYVKKEEDIFQAILRCLT